MRIESKISIKGEKFMHNIKWLLAIYLLLMTPLISIADETISFKGIKFGMNANQIAKFGGGDTKYGCASAINDASATKDANNHPWTYGGIDVWSAICVADHSESSRVLGLSGLFELFALVPSHNNRLSKLAGKNTYSVDDLVEIFSEVFGEFKIETQTVKNGLGQEFVKKTAISTNKDAIVKITDNLTASTHEDFINITITSIAYLDKANAWEKQKNNKKLNDSKADF